jgi:hypothetical protein
LPDFSQVLVWNPNTSSYTVYNSYSVYASGWADGSFNQVPAPILPVGQGFFLNPASPVTNVFAGTIAVNVGNTNSTLLNGNGGINYLVGSAVPYAGAVTNGNNGNPNYAGGLNLTAAGGLPDFSQLLIWNPNTSSYTLYNSYSAYATGWADASFNQVPPPQVSVGQGFFLNPASPFTWKVGL